MVHSGWSVDHGIMYQVQSTLPAAGRQVRSMESKPSQTRTLMPSDTWYMVLGT